MSMLHGIIGMLLLTLGRKLFWLFIGCLGFIAGLQMAELYFSAQPYWMVWAVALVFGISGALLALFFQGLAVVLGGFAAGSTLAAYLSVISGGTVSPAVNILGGLVGSVLLYGLFDWALIALSSLTGATLIVAEINWSRQLEVILFVLLIVAGMVFQTLLWRVQKSQ